MRIGAAFPTTEIGNDPAVIRDFAQAVEDLGYDHLTCIDHVLQGEHAEAHDWRAYYTVDNPFHEPLVLLAFVAAATRTLGLATAILILPQRPTVLVAKQMAELDVLSAGRLRAGVGVGWNTLEFAALGQDFHTRGRRIEEQIAVLRALWCERLVTFDGRWHRIENAGINPLPVQRPIPIWVGAFEPPAIRRAARLGDGWFVNPRTAPGQAFDRHLAIFSEAAVAAGRDPGTIGMDATLHLGGRDRAVLADEARAWRAAGVTHLTVRTMYCGFERVEQHIEALREARAALREALPPGT